MLLRGVLSALLLSTALNVQAAAEWVTLNGNNDGTTFINQLALDSKGEFVDIEVMRDFEETATFGNDASSGVPLYPHRSVTLTYRVDCASNTLAVVEWQMFEGNLGEGNKVWDQQNAGGLAFLKAVDAETRGVLSAACASTTVAR